MRRKVIYKVWVPAIYVGPKGEKWSTQYSKEYTLQEGTGIHIEHEGYFIDFGIDSEDGNTFTMAIIEDINGQMEMVHPSNVRFAEPYSKNVEEIERFLSR